MASLTKDPRRKKQYWICCFTAADGRQLKKSTKQTDKSKAWEVCLAFEQAEALARAGEITEAQLRKVLSSTLQRVTCKAIHAPTIRQWLNDWLAAREGTAAPSTLRKYRQVVKDFLEHLERRADAKLEAIAPADFVSFRDFLLEGGRTPQTVNQLVRKVLAAPFTLAVKLGQIAANPLVAIAPLRTIAGKKGVFTPEQVAQLVDAAEGDWKGVVLTGYYTGARLQDVTNLQWSSVDLDQRLITFNAQKTGTKILVTIHPDLEDHLRPLARNRCTRVQNPCSDTLLALNSAAGPVFPTVAGQTGPGRNGLSMTFKRIMSAAGVEGGKARERGGSAGRSLSSLSFHSLRHSFNSALAKAGVAQELRQKLTGHASAQVNDNYTHHEIETLRRAVDAIPRLPKSEAFAK
jgi:integrase